MMLARVLAGIASIVFVLAMGCGGQDNASKGDGAAPLQDKPKALEGPPPIPPPPPLPGK